MKKKIIGIYSLLLVAIALAGASQLMETANANFIINPYRNVAAGGDGYSVPGWYYFWSGSGKRLEFDALVTNAQANTTGTLMFWINPDSFAIRNTFSFGGSTGNRQLKTGITSAGNVDATMYADAWYWALDTDGTIPVTNWTHYALVQDGTAPVIYTNGVLAATTFTQTTDKTGWLADATFAHATIAALKQPTVSAHYYGYIADFRYYSEDLSATVISNYYFSGTNPSDTNLETWYEIGSGAETTDSSVNDFTHTAIGGPTTGTADGPPDPPR